mmetsp:Transcript_36414/g.84483  ORF Transcript_36414/g.84483 Transcript_36414/m.84483 type:complete len:241 (+) Transcript_36414:200-922(+)
MVDLVAQRVNEVEKGEWVLVIELHNGGLEFHDEVRDVKLAEEVLCTPQDSKVMTLCIRLEDVHVVFYDICNAHAGHAIRANRRQMPRQPCESTPRVGRCLDRVDVGHQQLHLAADVGGGRRIQQDMATLGAVGQVEACVGDASALDLDLGDGTFLVCMGSETPTVARVRLKPIDEHIVVVNAGESVVPATVGPDIDHGHALALSYESADVRAELGGADETEAHEIEADHARQRRSRHVRW